jgi:hypothetical protein
VILFPLLVATVAVSGRLWSRWVYWGSGVVLAVGVSVVWFGVANPGQALTAPAFVVVLPVAATFWVVSWKRFACKPGWAFIAALVVVVGAAFVGLVVGVNLGVVRP